MKKLLFILLTVISISGYAQTKSQLEEQIKYILAEQKKLVEEVQSLKAVVSEMKSSQQAMSEDNQQLHSLLNRQNTSSEQSSIIQSTEKKNVDTSSGRCQATTAKGTQCSRNAAAGSQYCWQHKGNQTPGNAASSTPSTTNSSSGSYNGSKTIQTGPRGGQYYINKNGNKTYVKRK